MVEKTCTRCGETKPLTEFYLHNQKKDRRYNQCKTCVKADRLGYYRKDPQKRINQQRIRKLASFGLTEADYDAMLAVQGGRCFICGKVPRDKRLAVDHDHKTGIVRGLLCSPQCNYYLIGMFNDNANLFARAAEYLSNPPAVQLFDPPRRHVDAPPIITDMESD